MLTFTESSSYLFTRASSFPAFDSYSRKEDALRERASRVESFAGKPRLFVLSDIGNEPDDQMSLTRLLLYSNEMNIEGLVATTSTWQKDTVRPDIMHQVLSNYGKIRSNLLKHAEDFPSLDYLSGLVKPGHPVYGMAASDRGQLSPGAQLLVEAVDRNDPRPLYVSIWGGANVLAEALCHIRRSRSPQELSAFVAKLRVYSISDQDDAGPWMRREFRDLFYIVSPSSEDGEEYSSATWTGISGDKYYRNAPGADFTTVSNSWLDEHVRSKGFLGETYPYYIFIMEGDTPSFLGLLNNGLASYRNPGWGGWGGRYIFREPFGESQPIWTQGGDCFPGKPNSRDTVIGVGGQSYTSDQATIWRWRKAFQHDFAARMDWTLQEFSEANHNPIVVVNGDKTKDPIFIKAKVGVPVTLSAQGSSDPDGGKITYNWFYYEEAASAISKAASPKEIVGKRGEEYLNVLPKVTLESNDLEEVTVVPRAPGVAHVILAVEDNGTPSLTSYRRIILEID
jgi:Protein of unknown function (DUF1593)